MCSVRFSIEEEDHNEDGFYPAWCRTAITTVQHVLGRLSHPPTISTKVPLLTVSSAKSKFQRRRPWLSFIKHQDCSAIATARIHLCCVASFSLSATAPALGFKAGQQINLVMNRVNQLLSWLTRFKAGQVANRVITYTCIMYHLKYGVLVCDHCQYMKHTKGVPCIFYQLCVPTDCLV